MIARGALEILASVLRMCMYMPAALLMMQVFIRSEWTLLESPSSTYATSSSIRINIYHACLCSVKLKACVVLLLWRQGHENSLNIMNNYSISPDSCAPIHFHLVQYFVQRKITHYNKI